MIYSDQFVISNMMKELDPDRPDAKKRQLGGFYRNLFEKLDRLSKLQLIVCPHSTVHQFESVVVSQFKKLREVFRHLSHGVSFQDTETILHAEILSAFDAWRSNQPFSSNVDRDFALTENPDVWQGRYRIDLNYDVPGLAAELKASSATVTARLQEVCQRWKDDPNFSFDRTFAEEMEAQGKNMIGECMRYAACLAAAQMGKVPITEVCIPPSAVSVMTSMMKKLAGDHPGVEKQLALIQTFFASEQFQRVPSCRIASLFWATIARDVHAGRQPDKFPKAGMFNDIAVVAAYSPFCDAMFVDKEIAHFASQAELCKELEGKARLFSLRKGDKDDFLAYLAHIEASASEEHLRLVREVYGPSWPTPFVDLLAARRMRE